MKTTIALLLVSFGGIFVTGAVAQPAAPAARAERAMLRIITIQSPDPRAYAQALKVEQAELNKNGVECTFHVWQAEFAGTEAGTVIVTLEFPSYAMHSRYLNPPARGWSAGSDARVRRILRRCARSSPIVSIGKSAGKPAGCHGQS